LEARSRRPKTTPRKISAQVESWIAAYWRRFGCSGEKIRLLLERDKKAKVSLPTIYRVLRRLGLRGKKVRREKVGETRLRSALSASSSRVPQQEIAAPAKTKTSAKIDGRYRVQRFIGSGGGGKVYLVEDEVSGRSCALKLLESGRESDPGLVTLLKNEFSSLASLHHPNLSEVFDLGTTRNGIYFTSEYIPGRDVLLAARASDLNTVFRLLVQCLAALDFLHRRGVLHLDLKPSNILVTDPDQSGILRVKLIDFGGAEWRLRGQAEAGETMGTPPYVAPELLMDRPASPASDLYALGMILHQVFYGRFPFRSSEPLAMMKEQVYEEPLALTGLPQALPEDFSAILAKLVARDPHDRFASAQEVLQAINRCLGEDFSLRPAKVPVNILRESDFLFHESLIQDLLERFQDVRPQVVVLSGPEGFGKTRVVTRVKELLQLRRVYPRVIQSPQDCEAYFKSGALPAVPLFLDWEGEEPEDFGALLQCCDERGLQALVTTRRKRVPEFFANGWLELPALKVDQLQKFFDAELADFPEGDKQPPLLETGSASPKDLEDLLEALQEEGALQWSDLGWRWIPEIELDDAKLLARHEARWRERRERCREILNLAPNGLDALILAGLLGVDVGVLREKLLLWERESWLKSRPVKNLTFYFSAKTSVKALAREASLDWPQLVTEWRRLYQEGQFEAVSLWVDALAERKSEEPMPPDAALWLARHCAAAGQGEKAVALLEGSASMPEEQGLYFEVLGRGKFLKGDSEGAERALNDSETAYKRLGDMAGLSRVLNLRASLAKKRADFSSAVSLFAEAVRTAQAAEDPYLAGLAEMNLGLSHQERGEFEAAIAAYEGAERSADQAGHPLLSGRLLQNRLNLAFAMGKSQAAESLCQELSRLAWKHHYPELQAAAFQYLALLAGQQGHQDLRLSYLNRTLQLLRSRDPSAAYVQALFNRAYFFWEQGNFTPAELEAGYALDLAKTLSLPLLTAWSQLLMGKILRDRPRADFAEAGRFLNRAHHGLHRLHNRQLLWEVEFDRGLLAKKQGEIRDAERFFLASQRSLEELMKDLPDPVRKSYLRDRKLERIEGQLKELKSG